jgi:hypothetical protein
VASDVSRAVCLVHSRSMTAHGRAGSWTFLVGLLPATAVLGALGGCSAKASDAGGTDGSAIAPCPATIEDTVGQTCKVEGMRCGPTFSCGPTDVPITCTCKAGTFVCIDGSGAVFDGGPPPACNLANNSGTCPPSESTADFAACTEAQIGQPCAYPAKCPGGTATFDVCTCQSAATKTGSEALVFVCENSCSGASGPLPDAGTPSPEAGTPPPEAGTPINDAASGDAPADVLEAGAGG